MEEKLNEHIRSIAELQIQVRFGIPKDCISMWSGTTIPIFWVKCDGANGTSNLIDKFLKGSNTAGTTGGSATRSLSNGNLPPNNHTFKLVTISIGWILYLKAIYIFLGLVDDPKNMAWYLTKVAMTQILT